jgi:hypothetical protein
MALGYSFRLWALRAFMLHSGDGIGISVNYISYR